MQLLKLKDISYIYPRRDIAILDGASLELQVGDKLALLGSNGSGKSTLLGIASGLLKANSGSVELCGHHCVSEQDFAEARRPLGYLLQRTDDMLFCPSVLEDVAFGPYNNGKSSSEAESLAWGTLRFLGIEGLAAFNGNHLSGGEKKLAALACVLSMQPQLLFLDEPTNDLDPGAREHFISLLEQLDMSSLIISHDMDFLQRVCTRFCVLEHGLIREIAGLKDYQPGTM